MTKSALPGRRMHQVKQMCVDGVQGSNIIDTTLTPMLLSLSFLLIYFLLLHFFFILVVVFGPVFQWVGFISRFLEDDQSFADKEKLARYGPCHSGRLPLLLVSISILNALIKYYPVLLVPQQISVSTAQNYWYISPLYAPVSVLDKAAGCLSTYHHVICH